MVRDEEDTPSPKTIETNILSYNVAFHEVVSQFVSAKDKQLAELMTNTWNGLFDEITQQTNKLRQDKEQVMNKLEQVYHES